MFSQQFTHPVVIIQNRTTLAGLAIFAPTEPHFGLSVSLPSSSSSTSSWMSEIVSYSNSLTA